MILDFIYDGISLSSYNYIICDFNASSSIAETNSAVRTFQSIPLFYGKIMPFSMTSYDTRLEFSFDIIKNTCVSKVEDFIITLPEYRYIAKWLCRPEIHVLKFVDPQFSNILFEGSFNMSPLKSGDDIIGIRCRYVTNRPFGIQEAVMYAYDFEQSDDQLVIHDISDEAGFIYPHVEITCKENGNLYLTNSYDNRDTIIYNCSENERIIMTDHLIIASDNPDHLIQNDFNYEYIRIANNYYNFTNAITSSLKCHIEISYNPIAKVVY